jgi:hypothetical protein
VEAARLAEGLMVKRAGWRFGSCRGPAIARNGSHKQISGVLPPVFVCGSDGYTTGELISLKGTDIDFNSRFVHVQRNLSRGSISGTKNVKDRKVDM